MQSRRARSISNDINATVFLRARLRPWSLYWSPRTILVARSLLKIMPESEVRVLFPQRQLKNAQSVSGTWSRKERFRSIKTIKVVFWASPPPKNINLLSRSLWLSWWNHFGRSYCEMCWRIRRPRWSNLKRFWWILPKKCLLDKEISGVVTQRWAKHPQWSEPRQFLKKMHVKNGIFYNPT